MTAQDAGSLVWNLTTAVRVLFANYKVRLVHAGIS